MKKHTERTLFHYFIFTFFLAIILLGGTSCKEDTDNDNTATQIVGTWHQTSHLIDGTSVNPDSTRLLFQIASNNICIFCDSTSAAINAKTIIKRSGWSYANGSLNIAIDLPASWKPILGANTLTLERVDFKQDGAISKTTLKFDRVAQVEIK